MPREAVEPELMKLQYPSFPLGQAQTHPALVYYRADLWTSTLTIILTGNLEGLKGLQAAR